MPEAVVQVTADQIEKDCPAQLSNLGKRIAAHLEKADKYDDKANNHRISAGQLLAEAKQACDDGGFTAFRERFCPNLGKSRAYELLAIASGKKSVEQVRGANAERKRRQRDAASVRDVTESRPPTTAEQAQAQISKAEVDRAKADFQKARAEAVTRMFGPEVKRIPSESRASLIQALSMLSSERAGERARAARIVEQHRARLGLAWDDLLVPAEAEMSAAA
jgi:hypothetical protein